MGNTSTPPPARRVYPWTMAPAKQKHASLKIAVLQDETQPPTVERAHGRWHPDGTAVYSLADIRQRRLGDPLAGSAKLLGTDPAPAPDPNPGSRSCTSLSSGGSGGSTPPGP